MAEYGFIASQGANVDELEQKLLRYDSRTTSFNIYMEGVTPMPVPTKTYDDGVTVVYTSTYAIAHGLNFTPTFLAYGQTHEGTTIQADETIGTASTGITTGVFAKANATNVTITHKYSGAKASITIPTTAPNCYHYIFSDPATSGVALTAFANDDAPKYGLRIAKDAKNIDSTYIQDYQFLYPPMKILEQGDEEITITTTGTAVTRTIPHGLPYRPAFRARILEPSSGKSYRLPMSTATGGTVYADARVDDTNLYVRFGCAPGFPVPVTATIKYTIYAERAK